MREIIYFQIIRIFYIKNKRINKEKIKFFVIGQKIFTKK